MASSFPGVENRLGPGVLAPLAQKKINLTYLTHLARDGWPESLTTYCTQRGAGAESYSLTSTLGRGQGTFRLFEDVLVLTLYPHEQRSEIKGNFIHSLARARILIRGLASSPSAMAAVLPAAAKDRAIQVLFEHFAFSSYASPGEFYAAQQPPEQLLREVVAAYQEKVIRVYHIVSQPDLELWGLSIPTSAALADLAEALMALGELGLRVPFLVAVPGPKQEFVVSFTLPVTLAEVARPHLGARLAGLEISRNAPVAAIFLHGPHFGDRYGIAATLVQALDRAQVPLLALSCCVSSISAVVKQQELAAALEVLGETFEDQSQAQVKGR